jgi:hypothetical protein
MVFVPLPLATARALRAGQPCSPVRGFAATPGLRRALGPGTADEEADFAALDTAGVAALQGLADSRRLVLAAEVPDGQVRDRGGELGEVEVRGLEWRQVRSLFADEESAGGSVRAAAAAAAGTALVMAFDVPAVIELSDTTDLLWYAPEELDGLR